MPRIPILPDPLPNSFALSTPAHMIQKLRWEIANLRRAIESFESIDAWRAPQFHAYNCAVTAWHCADWAWEYSDDARRHAIAQRFGFAPSKNAKRDAEMFFAAVCKQSRDILICRQIANGSKHMKIRKFDEAVRVQNGWKTGPNARVPSILDGDTERLAHDLFEGAADYWEKLFRSIGYLEDKFVPAD
jgi:hypothetical protein